MVDITNTVESFTYDKVTICSEPIIHDAIQAHSHPQPPDSGVRSPLGPATNSGVRLPPGPTACGVRLPPEPRAPDSGVHLPPEPPETPKPPDTQVLPIANTKSDPGINCPCCNDIMSVSHVCFDDNESIDTVTLGTLTEPNIVDFSSTHPDKPKKVTAPRFTSSGIPTTTCETYCFLAGFDTFDKIGHSGILYYKCSECRMFICHACKKKYPIVQTVLHVAQTFDLKLYHIMLACFLDMRNLMCK